MLFRDRPNSRAACRMLMPSPCTDRLTRAYTSTLYTSQVSHKTLSPCNVLEPKCGGLLFDRHKTPLTRAFCGQLLLRRLYKETPATELKAEENARAVEARAASRRLDERERMTAENEDEVLKAQLEDAKAGAVRTRSGANATAE